MSIRIAGTGSYVPERILTNADLEKMVETSDEWIRTRTGIEERRIAAPEQATSDKAIIKDRPKDNIFFKLFIVINSFLTCRNERRSYPSDPEYC